LIFVIGLFPNPILTRMHPSVEKVIARVFPSVPEESSAVNRLNPFTPSGEDTASTTERMLSRVTNDASRFTKNAAEVHQP